MAERFERRHVIIVSSAVLAATVASVWMSFFGAEELDLEAVLPWTGQSSVDGDTQALAVAVVFALPVIAALPLPFGQPLAARVATISFVLVSSFVVISVIRVGLFYLPTAYLLGRAAFLHRGDHSPTSANDPEAPIDA